MMLWKFRLALPIHWFLAFFRLNDDAVCYMSRTLGYIDYHDYPDDIWGEPSHIGLLVCKRCKKRFTI